MTPSSDLGADEGGEAPCFAHLLDEPEQVFDDVLTARVALSERDCCVGFDTGGTREKANGYRDGPAPARSARRPIIS